MSEKIKKALWFSAGCILLVIAYIGVFVPGLPWSTPTVGAAYCFAKSSKRMHDYLYNHKLFGPFLIGWQTKRIFPTRLKYVMLVTMCSSVALMWFTTYNVVGLLWLIGFLVLVAIWGFKYPGSEEEHQQRKDAGEKSIWVK